MILFDIVKLNQKVNTLTLEKESLEETIKNELYKEFMKKLGESDKVKRLTEENSKLRKERKQLKLELASVHRKENNHGKQKKKVNARFI